MKKIFTLALAAAATVAAGAAPADVTFVNKGNKATLANQVQVERFNPIADNAPASRAADVDLAGEYADGCFEIIPNSTGDEVLGQISARGEGFTIVADPEVENGYIIKDLFQLLFFNDEYPGQVNDLKATYNPATEVFSINPNQTLFVRDDQTYGKVDVKVITCDADYHYDHTLPIEFEYYLGQLNLKSPVIEFGTYIESEKGYLNMSMFLDRMTAWIPNGEMNYFSASGQKNVTVPIYGININGYNYVYNFADADMFNATPFRRIGDGSKVDYRAILGNDKYFAAAFIASWYPSFNPQMNVFTEFYLTEVEPSGDFYQPIAQDKYTFYVAGTATYADDECTIELPMCGLYDSNDTPWNVYENVEIKYSINSIAGIEAVEAVDNTDAPVVYYNLQGMRVENPQGGIFIRQQSTESTKVLIK